MAYCTQADIIRHTGETDLYALADRDNDGVLDTGVVAQAIAYATGTIDSYLAVKFVVPLTPPIPAEIERICVALAVCELQRGARSLSEDHKAVCDEAMAELQKIADGKKAVGLQPQPPEAPGAPGVQYEGQARIFGRDEPL